MKPKSLRCASAPHGAATGRRALLHQRRVVARCSWSLDRPGPLSAVLDPDSNVVRRAARDVDEHALRAFLETKIAKWWMPDAFVFIDAIPRTSTGKFLKASLRDRYKDWTWS